MEIEQNVQKPRSDTADQVEKEVSEVAKEVLDVVAEDPEEKHVAGDVKPAEMEEHAGYQGKEGDFKAGVPGKERRNAGRHFGVSEEQRFKGAARHGGLETQPIEKYHYVGKDQGDVDEGIGARRVEVLERDEHR